MATNEFLANNVVFQVEDPNTPGTWLTMVCETDLTGSLTVAVNTTPTKCATIKSVGEVNASISGSGVANTSPEADEISLKQAIDWMAANTLLVGRMINLAVSPVALGAAVTVKGSGYFTEVSPSAPADGSLTFDWTFEITGTIDTEESDESV